MPQGPGDLTGFIRFSLQQGLSENAIRRTLVESGVTEDRVAEAFRRLFTLEEIPPLPEEPTTEASMKPQSAAPPVEAELPELEVEEEKVVERPAALKGRALAHSLMSEPARPSHLVAGAPSGRSLVMDFNDKVELQPLPGRIQRVAIKEPGTISLLIRKRGAKKKSKKKRGSRGSGFFTTATLLLGLGACAMIWSGLNPAKVARQAEQVVRQAAQQGHFAERKPTQAPRQAPAHHQAPQRTHRAR